MSTLPLSGTFEESLTELERIVRQLEEGRVPLEQAVQAYERGAALKLRCEQLLKEARMKIDQVTVTSDGELKTVPSDLEKHLDE
jgi:exodeoxyribonuclease VII small subunit